MTPRKLDELRAVADPASRAVAAKDYIEAREQAIREARAIRDDAIRVYARNHSISETAEACGVSPATVKVIKR